MNSADTAPALPFQLPTLDEATARNLAKGPLGDQLARLVIHHMVFLVFGMPQPGAGLQFHNATCFFVRSPSKLLAVTARHVIRRYQVEKQQDDRTICQIGNVRLDPEPRLCGIGDRTGIATFEIKEAELTALGKIPISLWPPDPLDADDRGVLLGGFPGAGVIQRGTRTYGFGIYAATTVAQRVTDCQLTCALEWDKMVPSWELGGGLPPPNYDTGGMSGGPMLAIRERNGIMSFPIAGVISEGRAEEDKIIAERADSIRADGSIRG